MVWLLYASLVAAPAHFASAISSLIKVRPGALPSGSASHALSLARGDCEGFQIIAAPPLDQVNAAVEPLHGPGAPPSVRLYREAWVPVRTPSNGQGAPGLWPDPLIPVVDAYVGERRNALPFDSTLERPLVLYVEVCVPTGQTPGTYQGRVTLEARGRQREEIELTARVRPFTLPATSSLANSFGISIYSLAKGHHLNAASTQAKQLLGAYGAALLTHRLSAYGMGIDPPPVRFEHERAVIDFTDYDRELGPFLEGTALPSGARFTTTDLRDSKKAVTDEQKAAYYRAFREHFAQRRWPAQLFFYAKDEPKPQEYPLVLAQAKRVHQAEGVSVLVTSSLERGLRGAPDILCPVLNCFFPRPGPQTCKSVVSAAQLREQLGPSTKLWWYQSCNSHGCNQGPASDAAVERVYSGWASYMVDHPALSNRAMGVLAYLNGIDGELYYDTVFAYNTLDPWSDVFAFGGNGDGTLFYPGSPERIGGQRPIPIESLRLKQIRDGLEDYEYLTLLDKAGAGELAHAGARGLASSGYELSLEPARWEAARAAWTERLSLAKAP